MSTAAVELAEMLRALSDELSKPAAGPTACALEDAHHNRILTPRLPPLAGAVAGSTSTVSRRSTPGHARRGPRRREGRATPIRKE
jgi:hypothetical protein